MDNLGKWLREAREERGISLQDVEEVTRIRARYLEALEIGDFEALPGGEAQVRGFLRRYASFLKLSPEEAVARYNRQVHGESPEPQAPTAPPPTPTTSTQAMDVAPPRRNWLWAVGIIALVALVGFGVWRFVIVPRGATPEPTAPSPTAALQVRATTTSPLATPAPTTQAEAEPTPEATPTFPVAASEGVTLTLEPLEHVWVRVNVDGEVAFEGLLDPDTPQSWTAEDMVVVETGNGAGVIAVVNGQPQGPIGGRAEVSARGWGPEGELDIPPPSVSSADSEESSP